MWVKFKPRGSPGSPCPAVLPVYESGPGVETQMVTCDFVLSKKKPTKQKKNQQKVSTTKKKPNKRNIEEEKKSCCVSMSGLPHVLCVVCHCV